MSSYRILEGWQEENKGQFAEEYEALFGPNGFRCLLTEPEDRRWRRDLQPVIKRLEEQEKLIKKLQKDKERLDWLNGEHKDGPFARSRILTVADIWNSYRGATIRSATDVAREKEESDGKNNE